MYILEWFSKDGKPQHFEHEDISEVMRLDLELQSMGITAFMGSR